MTTTLVRPSPLHRLLRRVAAEIRGRHRNVLRELAAEVRHGGVILVGTASCFYGKQVAFHEFARLCTVPVIGNEIGVEYDWERCGCEGAGCRPAAAAYQ